MKRAWPAILMALAWSCLLPHVARAQDRVFASPPAAGRQAWFLDMLKTLADADGLDDPAKVGAILGVKFEKTVVTTSPSRMESSGKSFERDEYTPTTGTWFVPGPPGYASVGNFRPEGHNGFALGVDPVARGDSVNFKYFQSKRFGLQDENMTVVFDGVRDDSQASILFYGIDKFACVSVQDIQRHFPGVRHAEGSDVSAEQYVYRPPAREDSGTELSFIAPRGACLTEVSVDDFSALGKRFARAQYKFHQCVKAAAKSFCSGRPDGSIQDSALRGPFNAHVRQACGNLSAFYDKEPRTNQPPPEPLDYASLPWRCPYPR